MQKSKSSSGLLSLFTLYGQESWACRSRSWRNTVLQSQSKLERKWINPLIVLCSRIITQHLPSCLRPPYKWRSLSASQTDIAGVAYHLLPLRLILLPPLSSSPLTFHVPFWCHRSFDDSGCYGTLKTGILFNMRTIWFSAIFSFTLLLKLCRLFERTQPLLTEMDFSGVPDCFCDVREAQAGRKRQALLNTHRFWNSPSHLHI